MNLVDVPPLRHAWSQRSDAELLRVVITFQDHKAKGSSVVRRDSPHTRDEDPLVQLSTQLRGFLSHDLHFDVVVVIARILGYGPR